MALSTGDNVPSCTLSIMGESGPAPLTTDALFGGKRVILFALPGAFTPGCSMAHLPGFVANADKIKAAGVDSIACLSVNDAFVMGAWGDAQNASEIVMVADGNGEFTRKMGMLVDKSNVGFGMRSWRYSMLVNDRKIEKMFVEADFADNCPTDPFEVSDADTMLAYIKGTDAPGVSSPSKSFQG